MNKKYSKNKWFTLGLVSVGIFMSTLDGSIVNLALPEIMKDLGASLDRIQWVVMLYLLTVTSLLLSFGRLSDIKGRRWIYVRGLLVFSLGSFFCASSSSPIQLIASRLFQGVGAAMIMAATPAIVVDTFPVEERGRALGIIGAVVAAGLTTGPALGGLILHYFSWRVIFYFNIPIGILAAIVVNHVLRGGRSDISLHESFDIPGALLLAICLGSFLLGISHGYDWGYLSPTFLLLMVSAVFSLICLVILELRTKHPILSPSLLKIRLFTLPLISAVMLFASLFNLVFLMPFLLMNPLGYPPGRAGFIMVWLFMALFLVSPISGALSDRIGSRMLCTVGMGILSAAFILIAGFTVESSPLSIAMALALAGFGTAVFISPNSAVAMNSVPSRHKGIAAGMVAAARNLGMVLGIAIAGAIFNSSFYKLSQGAVFTKYNPEIAEAFMISFKHAIAAGGVIAFFGMIISFFRGQDRRKENRF